MDAKETSIYLAILMVSVVVLVLVVFFTVTMIRYQRRNLQLYKAKLAAEITTLEKERKRMAEDLHDELGPILAGIKLKLNSLDDLSREDTSTLDRVHENITRLINRMKEISNDLMPVVLVKKGLVAAVQHTAEEINHTGQLRIVFQHADLPVLDEKISINLYRIIQEILANTIKHAGANTLELQMEVADKQLILLSRDDGKGFDHRSAAEKHNGLGLRNLLSRTELLGGRLYVESAKGKGTVYRIEIPFQ